MGRGRMGTPMIRYAEEKEGVVNGKRPWRLIGPVRVPSRISPVVSAVLSMGFQPTAVTSKSLIFESFRALSHPLVM